MSLTKGSISLRLYHVDLDSGIKGDPEIFALAMRRYGFRPIDDERGEKCSFGWVDPFDPRRPVESMEDVDGGDILFLGWRRDTKALSGPIFKAEVAAEVEKIKSALGIKRVSRGRRLAAQEEVERRMLRDVSARTQVVDVVWDLADSILAVYSVSDSICDAVAECFRSTFDARLSLMVPGAAAAPYEDDVYAFVEHNAPVFLTDLWQDILKGGPLSKAHSIDIVKALEFARGRGERVQLRGEMPSDYSEAVAAGRDGKVVSKARFRIDEGERAWVFGLDASRFCLTGIKIKAEPAETELAVAVERYQDARHVFDLVDGIVKEWMGAKEAEPRQEDLLEPETTAEIKNETMSPVPGYVQTFNDSMSRLARKHGSDINLTIEGPGIDPVSVDYKAK